MSNRAHPLRGEATVHVNAVYPVGGAGHDSTSIAPDPVGGAGHDRRQSRSPRRWGRPRPTSHYRGHPSAGKPRPMLIAVTPSAGKPRSMSIAVTPSVGYPKPLMFSASRWRGFARQEPWVAHQGWKVHLRLSDDPRLVEAEPPWVSPSRQNIVVGTFVSSGPASSGTWRATPSPSPARATRGPSCSRGFRSLSTPRTSVQEARGALTDASAIRGTLLLAPGSCSRISCRAPVLPLLAPARDPAPAPAPSETRSPV